MTADSDFVQTLRKVNAKTQSDSFPIHRTTDCIDQMAMPICQPIQYAKGLLAGTFNPGSSQNFRVCSTKRFMSVFMSCRLE